MKTITLRELHAETGKWVRQAGHFGEITITDRGRTIARILPQAEEPEVPYFARRKLSPALDRILNSGEHTGGTDCTITISEDRDAR